MKPLIAIFVLFAGLLLFEQGWAGPHPALTLGDCQKCHASQYQQIHSNGSAHKEKVTCVDCHPGHRPRSAHNIPRCQRCHGARPHQKITDCSSCHPKNEPCTACHMAHQPLVWAEGGVARRHCQVCHPQPAELLTASRSKHHKLGCTFCHKKHGQVPACSDCHGRPHPAGTHQMFPQCGMCHGIAHDLTPL